MPWTHIFNASLLHFAFKSEVRSFLKLPIGARKIPATGGQGARTVRPAWQPGRVVAGRLAGARSPTWRFSLMWVVSGWRMTHTESTQSYALAAWQPLALKFQLLRAC